MPTPFTKTQGAGNDFILFDLTVGGAAGAFDLTVGGAAGAFDLTVESNRGDRAASGPDWHALAPRLCARHAGIGADGLLLVLPPSSAADSLSGAPSPSDPASPAASASSAPHARMRVINSDGSEPEMCGNGLRCVVRYLHARRMPTLTRFAIETGAGMRFAEVLPAPAGVQVRLDMGKPVYLGLSRLALEDRSLDVALVSMGNPHCVTFVPDLEALPFSELGPRVERHARFPQRVNAEFVQVLDRDRVRVKVWERGAGPTMACGTGACAVAVAAASQGLTDSRVDVELPGGTLTIDWHDSGHLFLTGPAELVFDGQVDLAALVAGA